MVERPKNHWKKQWGQWSAGQKTFNRIFSTLAKPLKTIDPNGVPEKNSFHSIALKNDSALQWVEVSPSPGMIYNPGWWRPTWHQRNYLIFSEFNSLPFDQTMQYPGGKTTIIQRSRLHWRWVLSFGELGRRRFRENCRDLKMHPVCNLQPCIIFWPQTLSPVKSIRILGHTFQSDHTG